MRISATDSVAVTVLVLRIFNSESNNHVLLNLWREVSVAAAVPPFDLAYLIRPGVLWKMLMYRSERLHRVRVNLLSDFSTFEQSTYSERTPTSE